MTIRLLASSQNKTAGDFLCKALHFFFTIIAFAFLPFLFLSIFLFLFIPMNIVPSIPQHRQRSARLARDQHVAIMTVYQWGHTPS